MSQVNPYARGNEWPVPEAGGPPKTSGLAIASFVCSVIICCPPTTIIGPLLGIGALVSISAKPMLRKGKGLAIAGIVIGVLVSAAWIIGTVWMVRISQETQAHIRNAPPAMFAAGFAGDMPAFRADAAGSLATATDAEVAAFFDDLKARHGDFVSLAYDDASYVPDLAELMSPVQNHPFTLQMADAKLSVRIGISMGDPATGQQSFGRIRIIRIIVNDPDLGDIEFP